jgi:uncharacterized protein (TIGR02118 family)
LIKVVSFLKRPDRVSEAAFRDWWLQEHGPIAAQLPDIVRYSLSFPADGHGFAFDGMAQMYFEDADRLERAFETPIGLEAIESAKRHAAKRVRIVMNEVEIVDRSN